MLKRKAIVISKIENAHGFILSMRADTRTSGRSKEPSLVISHKSWVPKFPVFKKRTPPITAVKIIMRRTNFLFIVEKNVFADIRALLLLLLLKLKAVRFFVPDIQLAL